MERLLIAIAIVAVVGVVALVAQRRRRPDAPTQRAYRVPEQLDRTDFSGLDVLAQVGSLSVQGASLVAVGPLPSLTGRGSLRVSSSPGLMSGSPSSQSSPPQATSP